ncbi:hypothetical protein H0H81_004395 [Sphagnurus paluster]|uniref:Ricin B lectin domain-containing protein n=1 Tax=Sphagnurus paluster TaxID=117069 RepID=A0A9P7GM46_9AGAR|nr:hypothetical protein H0H81_004395 [Sphagnurus paluster]
MGDAVEKNITSKRQIIEALWLYLDGPPRSHGFKGKDCWRSLFKRSGAKAILGQVTLEPGLTVNKCMTAASNKDGAIVTIEDCTYADNQKWVFNGVAVTIFGGTKCLDVPSGNTADGVKLQIWTCANGNTNQMFFYTRDNRLAWTNKGKCVDLTAGNQASGTRVCISLTSLSLCTDNNKNQIWDTGYNPNDLPVDSQNNQYGTNRCGTTSSQTSNCQTAYLNSAQDFCLFAPPNPNSTIGDTEHEAVSWCTKSGRGTRTIPNGTLKGVHFVRTPNYVQVTGRGDLTKLNIQKGDEGGELDNRGADGNGNPAGGLVFGNTFGNGVQYHEWTSFISDNEFCFRACIGGDATVNCNHIYDVMGCEWNIPANYNEGTFETCDGDDDLPMGVYGTSTWYQGVSPTPPAHPPAPSSNCVSVPTVSVTPNKMRRHARQADLKRHAAPFPEATPM